MGISKLFGRDDVPIRDGLTFQEDQKRVLDMLCLCGELDGLGPNESYSSYLRRILDALIEARRLTESERDG